MYEVDGLRVAENVVSSSFGASDPASRHVGNAAVAVGFRPKVSPASMREELDKGFEVLGVSVYVPYDTSRSEGLAVEFVDGTFEEAVGTPGKACVLWST